MKTYYVADVDSIPEGQRLIVNVKGISIGIFNVNGEFYALHNRCPHEAAQLCKGRICGTTLASDVYEYKYGREGEILRCPMHNWEFDVKTGISLVDEKIRTKKYEVEVKDGKIGIIMNR